jgi:hypothetical protein
MPKVPPVCIINTLGRGLMIKSSEWLMKEEPRPDSMVTTISFPVFLYFVCRMVCVWAERLLAGISCMNDPTFHM